jgi:hypothetical protein
VLDLELGSRVHGVYVPGGGGNLGQSDSAHSNPP